MTEMKMTNNKHLTVLFVLTLQILQLIAVFVYMYMCMCLCIILFCLIHTLEFKVVGARLLRLSLFFLCYC